MQVLRLAQLTVTRSIPRLDDIGYLDVVDLEVLAQQRAKRLHIPLDVAEGPCCARGRLQREPTHNKASPIVRVTAATHEFEELIEADRTRTVEVDGLKHGIELPGLRVALEESLEGRLELHLVDELLAIRVEKGHHIHDGRAAATEQRV